MNLATFFCLYIAQFIPSTFISTAMQVTMRQANYGLATIGLLHLLHLPWIMKFLWSPMVDRYCGRLTHYKRFILLMESIYALSIISIGFFDVSKNVYFIFVLIFIAMFASATQDIATDGLAVRAFRKGDHSAVNSMQSMGRYAGAFLGSGVCIVMLEHYGWNVVFPLLGVLTFMMIVPLQLNRDIHIEERQQKHRAKYMDFVWFFKRREIIPHVIFLLLYFMGIIGIIANVRPYMVDLGFDMKEIGVWFGMVGTATSFCMAWVGHLLVRRVGMYRARILVAVMIVTAPLYFLLLTFTTPTLPLLVAGLLLVKTCHAFASIVVYTTAMDCVREGREGTDFTVQVVVVHFSSTLISLISGGVGEWLDYRGLYLIELSIAIVSLIYVLWVFRNVKR
ncbi:MAG: MFS transporter [Prevotella sp.]|nr:MFS transporter [Prevotella sp.]